MVLAGPLQGLQQLSWRAGREDGHICNYQLFGIQFSVNDFLALSVETYGTIYVVYERS